MRDRSSLVCLFVTIGFFLLATFGGDVIARVNIAGENFVDAFTEHTHNAVVEPASTAFLLVPFLLLGLMAASLWRRDRIRYGLWLLVIGGFAMTLLYGTSGPGSACLQPCATAERRSSADPQQAVAQATETTRASIGRYDSFLKLGGKGLQRESATYFMSLGRIGTIEHFALFRVDQPGAGSGGC